MDPTDETLSHNPWNRLVFTIEILAETAAWHMSIYPYEYLHQFGADGKQDSSLSMGLFWENESGILIPCVYVLNVHFDPDSQTMDHVDAAIIRKIDDKLEAFMLFLASGKSSHTVNTFFRIVV